MDVLDEQGHLVGTIPTPRDWRGDDPPRAWRFRAEPRETIAEVCERMRRDGGAATYTLQHVELYTERRSFARECWWVFRVKNADIPLLAHVRGFTAAKA